MSCELQSTAKFSVRKCSKVDEVCTHNPDHATRDYDVTDKTTRQPDLGEEISTIAFFVAQLDAL